MRGSGQRSNWAVWCLSVRAESSFDIQMLVWVWMVPLLSQQHCPKVSAICHKCKTSRNLWCHGSVLWIPLKRSHWYLGGVWLGNLPGNWPLFSPSLRDLVFGVALCNNGALFLILLHPSNGWTGIHHHHAWLSGLVNKSLASMKHLTSREFHFLVPKNSPMSIQIHLRATC